MKRPWGRLAGRALRLGVALAAIGTLFWLLDRIGWSKIGQVLVSIGIEGALGLLALGLLENVFDAASLRRTLSTRVSVVRILGYAGLGGLVNVFVPWDAGEVVKATLIRRHVSVSEAIGSTVIWNYLMKLSRPLVGLVAACVGLVGDHLVSPSIQMLVVAASLLAFAPYLAIKLLLSHGPASRLVGLLSRLRLIRRDPARLAAAATELDHQIRHFHRERPAAYRAALGYQVLARVSSFLALYATLRLLGDNYPLATSALAYAAISVATYVYLLLPSRLGVGEMAGGGVFLLLGLGFDAGLLAQLVMRIKGIVSLGLVALLASRFVSAEPQRRPAGVVEP